MDSTILGGSYGHQIDSSSRMSVMISSTTLHMYTRLPGLTAVASYLPKTIVSFDGYFFDDDHGAHQSSSSRNNDGSSVPHKRLMVVVAPMIILEMNGCRGRLWERWKYVYTDAIVTDA